MRLLKWNVNIRSPVLYVLVILTILYFIHDRGYKVSRIERPAIGQDPPDAAKHTSLPVDKDVPKHSEADLPAVRPPAVTPPESQNHPESLIVWMKSRQITADKVPILTIVDSKYLRAAHSLRKRLGIWGYDQQLVVLCLDTACAEDKQLDAYPGLVQDGEVMHSVALLKVLTNLELAKGGYNFVFLDGDVYLTGSRDLFGEMLPLSNDTWDIQFQANSFTAPREVNIGWFFARASNATIEFFERSLARWKETQEWDQIIMNEIAWDMERANYTGTRLRVHRIPLDTFPTFMLLPWADTLFGNETSAAAFVESSWAIHFTCIEQSLKTYMGLNFGGFDDVRGYYSKAPALLRTANIAGTDDVVHRQLAFALQIAARTNRTLIWPDTVGVFQNRDHSVYVHAPRLPGVVAIDYTSAEKSGFAIVEGRYLQNRMRYSQERRPELYIKVKWVVDADIAQLEALIFNLSVGVVLVLDFENFGADWGRLENETGRIASEFAAQVERAEVEFYEVYERSGMRAYTDKALTQVAKCNKINGGSWCLNNC